MDLRSSCILVVDDEHEICDLLTHLLEKEGCRVLPTHSAEEAVALISSDEPAVALLDINLPGMDGLELAGEIQSRWPDCVIIMITGDSSVDTAIEAIHQGAFDYLPKPFFPLENVWAAVQSALEKRRRAKNKQTLLELTQQINQQMASILTRSNDD